METLQSTIFIEFDVNTKKITFLRKDNIIDYDSNATSVYVRVKYKDLSGNTTYLTPSELEGYEFSLYTIKPVTNNINEITGEVTDELKENVYGGVVKFEIPRVCTNRLGIVKCEIHINQWDKMIASSTFVLDVNQSLVTAFDDELLGDEDFPVLKQLILEIQKASNIDDNHRSKITTYSSDKIEDIKEDLSLQIKAKANENELDLERKRIDNLTTLAEGSTTGDAELIDARVGIDGVTYPNLGQAIRTQLECLNDKINHFGLPFTYSSGYSIKYSTGEVINSSNNSITDFIALEEGVTYLDIFSLNYPTKDSGGLAFYNENQEYISGYRYDNDVDLSVIVPKNTKYVRLTIPTASLNNVYITPNEIGILNQLKQEVKDCIGESDSSVYELTLTEGHYIKYTTGALETYMSNTMSSSDFVELNKEHSKLYVDNLNYKSKDSAGLAFYNADKTFIEGYQYDKDPYLCLDIPSNACYFRLTTVTASPATVYSKSVLNALIDKNSEHISTLEGTVNNLKDPINALNITDDYDYCQIFHKIAGIGDSLMSGELAYRNEEEQKDYYVDCYKYSWLSNLCKNIGAEPVHYSKGGYTTKTWLAKYLTSLKSDSVKPSAYFIALGTNDKSKVELGTVEDCGTENETFYGMYSKIITEVKQFDPNAKIFCFSLYYSATDENVINYCNAIKTMSERYGCYYVDFLNTYGYTYNTTNKQFMSLAHFTAPGYARVAKEMQTLINDIIRKNQDDFKFVGLNHQDI